MRCKPNGERECYLHWRKGICCKNQGNHNFQEIKNTDDLPPPEWRDGHIRPEFNTTFHTSEFQGEELTTKDRKSSEQDGSVEKTTLPSHETEHPVSPLSTPVDESMKMTPFHEEHVETEGLNQQNQLNEDVYNSESFLHVLNTIQQFPAHEHLLYSAWTEAGLLRPREEDSSIPAEETYRPLQESC